MIKKYSRIAKAAVTAADIIKNKNPLYRHKADFCVTIIKTGRGDFIMMVSTRGRYALRVMIDLAENSDGNYIPMKAVAERQNISLKYLERILPVLVKNNMIEGVQGKSGGYRLTKEPAQYRIGDILRLTEGDLAPVACLEQGCAECENSADCRTKPLWNGLYAKVNEYLDGITIAALMKK